MKIRLNDTFRNMVTGEKVIVTEMKDGLIRFDNGMQDVPEEVVKECFQFIENKTPFPVPEASITDGSLFVDGEKIETGIMKPAEILACVPGGALILTETKEGKNLVRYCTPTEKFMELADKITSAEVLFKEDKVLVYKTVTTKERKVPVEKEGEDPVSMMDYADMVYILKEGECIYTGRDMILDAPSKVLKTDCGKLQLFFERKNVLKSKEDIYGETVKYLEEAQGIDLVEFLICEDVDEETEEVLCSYVETCTDHYSQVKEILPIHGGYEVLVVTGNGIHIYNRRHMAVGEDVLAAVESHPHLVRFTPCSHVHDHDTFVFADDEYNTVAIRVTRVGGPVGYVTEIK